MGRPSTKPKDLKDGFYIEVRNRGAKSGIKIQRDTEVLMMRAFNDYQRTKDVIVLGEIIKGKWQNDKAKAKAKKAKSKKK